MWLAIIATACALTGHYAPAISAQAQGQPPQLTTFQLMSQESVEAQHESAVLGRRRIVRRPALEPSAAARLESETAEAPIEVTAAATFLQSYAGPWFGELGSLPPDPSGAAGPSQFILAANGRIRSYSRATGAPTAS